MTSIPVDISTIKKEYSYAEYFALVNKLVESGSTTGHEQSSARIEATKINAQRMKRIGKTYRLSSGLTDTIKSLQKRWKWILIAEAWCGDGAQCIPVIAKIAEASENIELKIILRDENPLIMDKYLTNGAKAIPKLICIDKEKGIEIGTWGARPAAIQNMVKEFKSKNPDISHDEFVKNLHLWYAQDKGKSIDDDFCSLLKSWSLVSQDCINQE